MAGVMPCSSAAAEPFLGAAFMGTSWVAPSKGWLVSLVMLPSSVSVILDRGTQKAELRRLGRGGSGLAQAGAVAAPPPVAGNEGSRGARDLILIVVPAGLLLSRAAVVVRSACFLVQASVLFKDGKHETSTGCRW